MTKKLYFNMDEKKSASNIYFVQLGGWKEGTIVFVIFTHIFTLPIHSSLMVCP